MDPPRMMFSKQTAVALSLTKRLMSVEAKDVNFVFSPPSIHVMLSLVAAGSKGQTLDELLLFLKSDTNELNILAAHIGEVVLVDALSDGGPNISFVNGVWVDHTMPFSKKFRTVVDGVYKAKIEQVDFWTKHEEAREQVNSWALKETNGLIKGLLPPGSLNNLTRFILANAIYFKGQWAEKFDASFTENCYFHLLNGSSVKVPFMTSWEDQFVAAFDGFKVLQLPYRQNDDKRHFSMSIFLPDTRNGLPALMEKLCLDPDFINKHTPLTKVEVGEFRIPKFKTSYNLDVAEVLKDLGLTSPFRCTEGFTEMVDSAAGKDLFISGIYHKSFIEVNEEGTEAAAATGVVFQLQCLRPKMDFVADHPFAFVVRENVSGVILFIGHILNPLEGN